ncbi:cupin domain-containing protein [Jannaschia seohaensis]
MNEIPDAQEAPARARAESATQHGWGAGCDGWRLVETPGLRAREGRIPPGCGEHLHLFGQQVSHILSGTLTIDLPREVCRLGPGDLLHVSAGVAHEVRNDAEDPVRCLLLSAPTVEDDRGDTAAPSLSRGLTARRHVSPVPWSGRPLASQEGRMRAKCRGGASLAGRGDLECVSRHRAYHLPGSLGFLEAETPQGADDSRNLRCKLLDRLRGQGALPETASQQSPDSKAHMGRSGRAPCWL